MVFHFVKENENSSEKNDVNGANYKEETVVLGTGSETEKDSMKSSCTRSRMVESTTRTMWSRAWMLLFPSSRLTLP